MIVLSHSFTEVTYANHNQKIHPGPSFLLAVIACAGGANAIY